MNLMNRRVFLITNLICVIIGLLIFTYPVIGMGKSREEQMGLKAKFYRLDKKTYTKGEFLGTVEIKGDDFEIEVKDSELEEFLKQELKKPYKTFVGEISGGLAIEREVDLVPGTPEHLKAIFDKLWKKYRIIGEIEEK